MVEFKVGDKVRINSGGPNDGKVSTITRVEEDAFNSTIYTLDSSEGDLSCVNWTAEYLEKVPKLKPRDLVMYRTGTTVYKIKSFDENNSVYIESLKNGVMYTEPDPNKLVKLKFQPGDRVEITAPFEYQGQVKTVLSAEFRTSGIFYKIDGVPNIKFAEKNLKLVETPEFKKGDIVYVNHNKVENKEYCYKIFTVVGSMGTVGVACEDSEGNPIALDKAVLVKPKFSIGKSVNHKGIMWTIKSVYFAPSAKICYLLEHKKYGTITFYEKDLQRIVDNPKLNNNDKNQLQREAAPERGADDQGQGRIYGRKPNVKIKVGHLSYQTVAVRSQKQVGGS